MSVLRIDGVDIPLSANKLNLPSFDVKRLCSCQAQRIGDTLELRIKASALASRLFGLAESAYPSGLFNDDYHYGEVVEEGVVIFSGVVSYISTEYVDCEPHYNIKIVSGGATWADLAATTKLKDTPIEASRFVELASICESWTDDNPIKMLPMNRDSYPEADGSGLYQIYHPKLPQDYHPFISVKALMESILCRDGYSIKSKFLSSPFFEKLMMSGAYKGMDSEMAYATMGFYALRSTTASAKADSIGRVDISPPVQGRYLGALVDTVTPTTIDENGEPCQSAYTNGGCFTFENGVPTFRPKRDIDVAFDLHFSYTTDYKLQSSKWLKGFTKLYVGSGCYVDVALPNPYTNRCDNVSANIQYKLYIFDYDETASYNLTGYGEVSGRVSTVLFTTEQPNGVKLFKRGAGEPFYMEYVGDWALYDGYVADSGSKRVEFTLRTPYEHCTPASPKQFNNIYFCGAEQGQQLTLHPGCSIAPVFGGTVGYGKQITFEDIANHDIRNSDIVEAITQMFNLRIYTHKPSKTIFIEPYDDFFSGDVYDWRTRQCDSNARYEECVADSFMLTRLGYQPADGAVSYCYGGDSDNFGAWSYFVDSYATKQSVNNQSNPLFHPTASMPTLVGTAPSATVLVVGDRDRLEDVEYVEPRIVLYHGVKRLPKTEYWPHPIVRDSYPCASFHSVEEGETLCFDDRDGIAGLHRYYNSELRECATCQKLTTEIYLPPEQYVALFDPNSSGANLRSRFMLNVQNTPAIFRLDAIEEYDNQRYIARCRFQRLCEE